MSGSTNWEQVYKIQSAQIEELERENAALREDRARLDYLTQSLGWIVVGWPEMDPSDYATEEGTLTDFWIAAIDAARAKEDKS